MSVFDAVEQPIGKHEPPGAVTVSGVGDGIGVGTHTKTMPGNEQTTRQVRRINTEWTGAEDGDPEC